MHIAAVIAAIAAQAAGRADRAAHWVEQARRLDDGVSRASFLRSFPFAQASGRETIEKALRDLKL